MSDSYSPNKKDRLLQKALTNRIVDEYFEQSESWLRAILRMCIFSLLPLNGKPALLIECPNQAVAKRLSRKTLPLQDVVQCLAGQCCSDRRVLICYQQGNQGGWRCFDTNTNTWKAWENQTPTAPTDS